VTGDGRAREPAVTATARRGRESGGASEAALSGRRGCRDDGGAREVASGARLSGRRDAWRDRLSAISELKITPKEISSNQIAGD
jgi:hypothetical protein